MLMSAHAHTHTPLPFLLFLLLIIIHLLLVIIESVLRNRDMPFGGIGNIQKRISRDLRKCGSMWMLPARGSVFLSLLSLSFLDCKMGIVVTAAAIS